MRHSLLASVLKSTEKLFIRNLAVGSFNAAPVRKNIKSYLKRETRKHPFMHVYSQTCIRRICIKQSPSIKQSLTKVPKIVSLYYSKTGLY